MDRKALYRMTVPLVAVCFLLADCTGSTTTTPGPTTAFAVTRFTDTGALDTTFAAGRGVAITDINPGLFDFAVAVAVQPADNKIIAAGSSGLAGAGTIALVRYNAVGTADTTFGTNGIVTTPLPAVTASASAITVQPDNKILVAALTFVPTTGNAGTAGIALLRYNPDGTLDTTGFGAGKGFVTAAIGPGVQGDTCALLLLAGGKIVVAGGAQSGNVVLYGYDSAGVLDPGFGTAGATTTLLPGANTVAMSPALALQPVSGKIILVGGTSVDQVVLRYNTNGTLDTTFGPLGANGIVVTDIGNSVNFGNAVAVQDDDKIVVAGHTNFTDVSSDISLVRYNADGTLDATFGAAQPVPGIVTKDLGGIDGVFSIALQAQPPGAPKILVSGNISTGNTAQLAVLRYLPDGTLDPSFDVNGVTSAPLVGPSNISSANAVVLQAVPSGVAIVVAGYD